MKVLLASPYGGVPGGISRWTEHIIKYYTAQQRKDYELTLLPMGRSTFVNIGSGLLYRLKYAIKDYSKIIKSFNKQIKAERFDVMHLTSSASLGLMKDLYMLYKACRNNIKTVIHFRFGRMPELAVKKNWEWKLLVKVLNLADTVVVIDKKSYDTLKDLGYNNVEFLPNPVAPEVVSLVEENANIKREDNLILFTGHVVKTKGVIELVETCNQLKNVRVKFVGHVEEEMKNELLKIARCNVEIKGEMPYQEVIREMLRCDVFALPTYTEGFPNVILESMAAGCAIVTTDVGAIPQMLETVDGKHYGLMVKPKDVIALKEALDRMLSDEDLKRECRRNVKVRVNERYSIDSVWEQMTSIWEHTLEK